MLQLLALNMLVQLGGQGGPINLQRFIEHHPPTFTGGGDPVVANHWFRHIERILEAMEITSDATRIRLAIFRLEGESQIWWDWVKVSLGFGADDVGRVPRELFMISFSQHQRDMQKL